MSNEPAKTLNHILPLSELRRAYFIGIGGIGMSALARYLHSRGVRISGYDKTPTPLTDELNREGIEIHFEDDPRQAPDDAELVVYTPAIPAGHLELNDYRQKGYPVLKRSEVLEAITADAPTIAVAGTHGKTTTSSTIAYLLRESGLSCWAFLGGITRNYDTNFLAGEDEWIVVEADEYDRSFLRLRPDIALVTSMDPDHLDIYGDEASMLDTYAEFAAKIKPGGFLLCHARVPILPRLRQISEIQVLTYRLEDQPEPADGSRTDFLARNIRILDGAYQFDLAYRSPFVVPFQAELKDLVLNSGGRQNVENAAGALAAALLQGRSPETLKATLANFAGVQRRFDYHIKTPELVMIDDYAHHPEELRALLSSTRELYPDKTIAVIFQPHLFSRTRDFLAGFSESLSLADRVLLLPIYPAREEPIPGITSEKILEGVTSSQKNLYEKDDLLRTVQNDEFQILVVAGAGDIAAMLGDIKKGLEGKG